MALIKPIIYTYFDAEKFKVIYFSFSRRYNYLQKNKPYRGVKFDRIWKFN